MLLPNVRSAIVDVDNCNHGNNFTFMFWVRLVALVVMGKQGKSIYIYIYFQSLINNQQNKNKLYLQTDNSVKEGWLLIQTLYEFKLLF